MSSQPRVILIRLVRSENPIVFETKRMARIQTAEMRPL